jgi:hypothetical protein
MTNKELQEILKQYPDDYTVIGSPQYHEYIDEKDIGTHVSVNHRDRELEIFDRMLD